MLRPMVTWFNRGNVWITLGIRTDHPQVKHTNVSQSRFLTDNVIEKAQGSSVRWLAGQEFHCRQCRLSGCRFQSASVQSPTPWRIFCGRCPLTVAFLWKQGLPSLLAYSFLTIFSHPTNKLKIVSIELILPSCFSLAWRHLPQLFSTALKLEMTWQLKN